MLGSTSVDLGHAVRSKAALVALLVLAFMGVTASQAWATLEIQSYNDPAGDPTVQSYALLNSDGSLRGGLAKNPFPLTAGERKSFGPPAGTYIWKAQPAAGWKVAAISCQNVDPVSGAPRPARPGEFTVDVANGQVTIVHAASEDQYCAFTNQKVSAASGAGSNTGVSPTLPGVASAALKGPALLQVTRGLRFATAKVRISRQSIIKAQLLKGKKVVGTTRVTRNAGTHNIKVTLAKKYRQSYLRQGRKRVTLTLKVVVVGSNRSTKVFRYGVVVRLS
jgi:hypothetical protein